MYLDVSRRFLDSLVDNIFFCSERLLGKHLTKASLKKKVDKIILGDLKSLDVNTSGLKKEFLYLKLNESQGKGLSAVCTIGRGFEYTNYYFKSPEQELLAALLTVDKLKEPLKFKGKVYKADYGIFKRKNITIKNFERIKNMLENYIYNVGGSILKIDDNFNTYKIEFTVKIPNKAPFSGELVKLLLIMAENYEDVLKKVAFREILKNNQEIMELINEEIRNVDSLGERIIKLLKGEINRWIY